MTHTQLRQDLWHIVTLVKKKSRVLEIGCGSGELLAFLKRDKKVDARGIELQQDKVSRCVQQGLAVIQGDVETDLAHYPNACFDYVISSDVLQAMHHPKEVLNEMLRVGQHVIVAIPNFGYWKNRLYLLLKGKMPVTKSLSYEWYETPNIHFCTLKDFAVFCKTVHAKIEKKIYLKADGGKLSLLGRCFFSNWFASKGIYVLTYDDRHHHGVRN